jgi:hypothetical protein
MLRQRLSESRFAAKFNSLERAEIDLLVTAPQDFVTCTARRMQEQKRA